MKTLLVLSVWLLLVVCWPVAIGLILWPVVWLLSLPLALIGIGVAALLAFIRACCSCPARLLGHGG